MARTIAGTTAAVSLIASDNPLLVTGTGAVIGSSFGIYGRAYMDWTITNKGTVRADGPAGSYGNGITLDGSGTVLNRGGAYVRGDAVGVAIRTAGCVGNDGTIIGGVGVQIRAGAGTVANSGTITGYGPARAQSPSPPARLSMRAPPSPRVTSSSPASAPARP